MINIVTQAVCSGQLLAVMRFYASKMQASSTQNNRDSAGKRLGVKKYGGQEVLPGDIIARQRGFKWQAGENVIVGKDQTIHAKCEGVVRFRQSQFRKVPFYYIDVVPACLPNRHHRHPAPYIYHPELFPDRQAANHPEITAVDPRRVTFLGKEAILQKDQQFMAGSAK